jgi:hypothetical protein
MAILDRPRAFRVIASAAKQSCAARAQLAEIGFVAFGPSQ